MDELGAIAEDRSRIYWLLAGFFLGAPEPAYLDALRGAPADQTPDESELGAQLAQFRRSLADDNAWNEVHGDFFRLFLGLREGYGLPPPYESLHREGRLLGQSTEAVMEHFRRSGISLAHEGVGPEDHLGLEFKFLSLLCLRESQAWRHADASRGRALLEAQRAFLEQHLCAWVPDYCRRVADDARTDYYRSAAGLTAAAIGIDARQIAATLEALTRDGLQEATQGGLQ
jgi:TorA maturation chaperone TorD